MEPKVEGLKADTLIPDDFMNSVSIEQISWSMITQVPGNVEKFLNGSLKRSIGYISLGLIERFKTIGKFVYPGNGSLSFRKAIFGNLGNVLAEVDFKP